MARRGRWYKWSAVASRIRQGRQDRRRVSLVNHENNHPNDGLREQAPPHRPQRDKLIGFQPRQPARRFCLRVCPMSETIRRGQLGDLVAESRVPRTPHLQMFACWQQVSFLGIASAVCQDEVMAKINRITVHCDARNQTISESVAGFNGIVVDLVFRIGRRYSQREREAEEPYHFGPQKWGLSKSSEKAKSATKDYG